MKGGVIGNGLLLLRQPVFSSSILLTDFQRIQCSFVRTITSLSPHRSVLSSTSFRMAPSTCLRRPPVVPFIPLSVSLRRHSNRADRGDIQRRPPQLDLKSQNSQVMNELQKEQTIKDQQKNSRKPAKPNILEEKELSRAEQRRVNWSILKTLVKYIWPKVNQLFAGLMVG
jgi:hypothetical protein